MFHHNGMRVKVETEKDIDEFADNSVIYTIVKALTRALYDGAVN